MPATRRNLDSVPVRVVSARVGLGRRLAALWSRRELLGRLIVSDIRIKYKGSALGFVWSLLAPALTLTLYFLVFSVLLKNGVPNFALYLFSGLIVWNFFLNATTSATGVIVERAPLVKKVAFPREILPLANVGSAIVYFFSQLTVLVIFMALTGHAPDWPWLPLLPVAFAALILFTAGVAMVVSALTVYLRDVKHLMEVALMVWFFATPIVYSYENSVAAPLHRHGLATLYFLNPVSLIVLTFQRVFYVHTTVQSTTGPGVVHILPTWPLATFWEVNLGLLAVMLVFFLIAEKAFGRLEENFESTL